MEEINNKLKLDIFFNEKTKKSNESHDGSAIRHASFMNRLGEIGNKNRRTRDRRKGKKRRCSSSIIDDKGNK